MTTVYALSWILMIYFSINLSTALECYVCDNQEDNNGKCVQTIKTCEYGEDMCLSEIKWGSTPYWQQGALKQYYVSKRCSTKELCPKYRSLNMPLCTYIWYQDWKCSECCRGDRCNYYIISGSNTLPVPVTTVCAILFVSIASSIYQFYI